MVDSKAEVGEGVGDKLALHDVRMKEMQPENVSHLSPWLHYDAKDKLTVLKTGDRFLKLEPVVGEEQPRYIQIGTADDIASPIHGGMGVIRKMKDRKTERIVAAKKLFTHAAYTLDEARVLAKFQHPNVVTIYDLAISNPDDPRKRKIYIITEWLEGITLADWLEDDHKLNEIAKVMDQAAKGIDHINKRGYVYGDLKPMNVMVDGPERVKLVDLGIAYPLDGEDKAEGMGIATFGYAPPEQETGKLTLQTDVFSYAAVLYEALVNEDVSGFPIMIMSERNKFAESEEELIPIKKAYAEVFSAHPREYRRLSEILRKALSEKSEARHSSIGELNREVQEVFSKLPNMG